MAGLLDIDMSTPEGQGFNSALLAAAQALLTPRARGGGMGAAFAAFPAAMDRAKQQAMREQLMALQQKQVGLEGDKLGFQMDEIKRKAEAERIAKQNLATFLSQFQANGGKVTPDMVSLGVSSGLKVDDLSKLAGSQNWGRTKLENVNGVGVDPYTWKPSAAIPDPNKPFNNAIGPDGRLNVTGNPALQNYEMGKAKASAPKVDVRVDNKMGESLGAQIGPILAASRSKTEGAIKLGMNGQQIIDALDSGKVIAGPGASLRLLGAQFADVLGVGGKDNAERILNTRRVIRGLAESAVEARKELAGQGQVTENEAKAVEKAMSGNIDDLTADEIRLIAGLNVKAAHLRAGQHQQMLSNIPEAMRSVTPFYSIPGMDQWLQQGGFSIRKLP